MKMLHYQHIVGATAHLHNFCINEWLHFGLPPVAYDADDLTFDSDVVSEREQATELESVSDIAKQMSFM